MVIRIFLALVLTLLPFTAAATQAERNVHESTLSLYGEYDKVDIFKSITQGQFKSERWRTTCSGTAVKSVYSNVMLTATHCYHGDFIGNAWRIDGVWRKIDKVWANGEDQMLVRFKDKNIFDSTVPMVRNARLSHGDNLFWFGNPNGLVDMLRRGYVAGFDAEAKPSFGTLIVDASGWYGDSGSGIFTADGRLIGTCNRFNSVEFRALMEVDTIKFTDKQLREAGVL